MLSESCAQTKTVYRFCSEAHVQSVRFFNAKLSLQATHVAFNVSHTYFCLSQRAAHSPIDAAWLLSQGLPGYISKLEVRHSAADSCRCLFVVDVVPRKHHKAQRRLTLTAISGDEMHLPTDLAEFHLCAGLAFTRLVSTSIYTSKQ